MKTTMRLKSMALIALSGAMLAAPVLAQGGPGMGYGMAGGPGMQNRNGAPGAGRGMAPCGAKGAPGMRGGRGMAFNQGNTRGWELMTPEERGNFQKQMRSVKTYDECVAVQTGHRGAMEVRAKEQGVTLQTPRQNACENLKARGVIE